MSEPSFRGHKVGLTGGRKWDDLLVKKRDVLRYKLRRRISS